MLFLKVKQVLEMALMDVLMTLKAYRKGREGSAKTAKE
jgi:hypothetical protein